MIGAEGSSGSRNKSRSPPPGVPGKDQRRSRGSRISGVGSVHAQSASLVTSAIRTPGTRRPSSSSLLLDPLGRAPGLPIDATTLVMEQRRTALNDVLGPSMGGEARATMPTPPRSRISSHPPLAPQVHPPMPDQSVESQVDAIMQELMAKSDQVRSMEAGAKDREAFAFLAEARPRVEEKGVLLRI